MTELDFLIDLLLHFKLNAKTKDHLAQRISDVQKGSKPIIINQPSNPIGVPINGAIQSPSTIAAMQRHAAEDKGQPIIQTPIIAAPIIPVSAPGIIAGTPATAAAMESRNTAIALALQGKNEKGRTSPRKF